MHCATQFCLLAHYRRRFPLNAAKAIEEDGARFFPVVHNKDRHAQGVAIAGVGFAHLQPEGQTVCHAWLKQLWSVVSEDEESLPGCDWIR